MSMPSATKWMVQRKRTSGNATSEDVDVSEDEQRCCLQRGEHGAHRRPRIEVRRLSFLHGSPQKTGSRVPSAGSGRGRAESTAPSPRVAVIPSGRRVVAAERAPTAGEPSACAPSASRVRAAAAVGERPTTHWTFGRNRRLPVLRLRSATPFVRVSEHCHGKPCSHEQIPIDRCRSSTRGSKTI
jgi:hypothetical protein